MLERLVEGKKDVVNISCLDELASKDEVMRAVRGKIGDVRETDIIISELRSNRNNMKSATVTIPWDRM